MSGSGSDVRYYLCSGNRTGIASEEGWRFVELPEDVRELDFLPNASFVFATPPCNGFSEMPWRKPTYEGYDVLEACYRLCKTSGAPWLLENNRGAQKFMGPADFHRGGHYFWGEDVGLIPSFTSHKERISGKFPLKRAALPVILP